MYPFSRDNLFSFNSSTHSYDTRHAFHLPYCKYNAGSVFFQSPAFFNTLTCKVKNTPTLASFNYYQPPSFFFFPPDANLALHLCIFFDVLCGTIFLFLNLGENLIACKHRGFI